MNPSRRFWMQRSAAFAALGTIAIARRTFAQSAGSPAHAPPHAPNFGPPVNGLRLGLQWVNNFGIAFVLENVSNAPITVLSHVAAGNTHLDWFELRVESATHNAPPRTLRFIETSTRSGRVIETIAPGARHAQAIDTRYWGHSASNPAPGWHTSPTYLLTAIYDTSHETERGVWHGRLESGTNGDWIDLG